MALPQCPINFQWDPLVHEQHKSQVQRKMRLSPLAGKRDPSRMPHNIWSSISEFVWSNLATVKASREFATLVKNRFVDHMEIMRVIWLWVGAFIQWDPSRVLHATASEAYDTSMTGTGDAESLDESPDVVMRTKQAGSEGIANVLVDLCRKCGIRAKKIRGYAKLLGYRPGQKLYINHVWNGVCIDKRWYLLDLVCGLMSSKEVKKHTINLSSAMGGTSRLNLHKIQRTFARKELNDFYFMCPPKKFLIDHWPQMDRWQLMNPVLPLEEFDKSYYLTPFASEFNLHPYSEEAFTNVIHTNSNYLRLAFHSPQMGSMKFMVKVTPLSASFEDHHYSVIQRSEEKKVVIFHMIFPYIGTYRVLIYVAENHKMFQGVVSRRGSTDASLSLVIPSSTSDGDPPVTERKKNKLNYRLGADYLVHASEGLTYQVGFMRALVGWQSSAAALNPRGHLAVSSFSNFSHSRIRSDFHVICPAQHELLWRHTVYFQYHVNRKVFKEVALRMNPHQHNAPPDRRTIPWCDSQLNVAEGNIFMIASAASLVLPFIVQVEAQKVNSDEWKTLTFYQVVDSFERINHDRIHPQNYEEPFLDDLTRRNRSVKVPFSLQQAERAEGPKEGQMPSDKGGSVEHHTSIPGSSRTSSTGDVKDDMMKHLSIVDFNKYTFCDCLTHHKDEIMTDYAMENNIVVLSPESTRNEAPCTSAFSVQLSTTSENVGFLLEVSHFDTQFVPLQNIEYFNNGSNVLSFLLPMMKPGDYGVRILGFEKEDPNSISAAALLQAPKTHLVAEFSVRFIKDFLAEENASRKYYFQSQIPLRIYSPKIQNFPLVPGYKYQFKCRVDNPQNLPLMMGDSELCKEGDLYETQFELTKNMELHFKHPHTAFFRSFFEAKPVNDLKLHYGPVPEPFDALRMKNSSVKLSEYFLSCGGRCVSHLKQTFTSYDQVDSIKISVPSKDHVVSASLYHTMGELPEQCVDVCSEEDTIVVLCMYPRAGLYKLCIRLRNLEDDRTHDALHYWIEARGADLYLDRKVCLFGFPERLYSCPLGIRIYSPNSLFLLNREEHNFQVRLDKVYASTRCALVMSNGDVFTLDQSPTDPFIFMQEILFDRDENIQEATLQMYQREEGSRERSLIRFFVLSPRMWKQYAMMQ